MFKNPSSLLRSIGSKILLALLIITFGVWGIADIFTGRGGNATVASVVGEHITAEEYQRGVYRETEKLRAMLGKQFNPEMAKNFGIEPRVLQNLIDNRLLVLESKSMGLRVSDADVVRNIRTSQNFQGESGNFSKGQFEAMLKATGQTEKEFIQKMREDMAVKLLITTITENIPPPEHASAILLAARGEERTVDIYTITPALIKAPNAPNDDILKAFYDANAKDYTTPEYRKISYVTIAENSIKKTAEPSEAAIESAYKDRAEEFKKPERRKVSQLLFGNEDSAKKAYAEIKGGKTLEEIKKTAHILNPTSISLGLLEKANVPTDAAEQVFALKVGEITTPIKSAFGWHIFQVSEILPAATQPLAEVKAQIVSDLQKIESENALSKLSNQLEDAIASGASLADAAKEFGLKITSLPEIDKSGRLANGEVAKEIPVAEKFLEIAFKTDEKTESQLITGKAGISYILRVESIAPEHLQDFADVKAKLITGWTNQEKEKQLTSTAQKIAEEFANGSAREKSIKTYGLPVPSSVTVSRSKDATSKLPAPMVMDIFAKKIGGSTGAFVLPSGDFAIAVIKNITPAKLDEKNPKTASELADIKKQYNTSVQNEIIDEYLKHLAHKYKISVNLPALQIKNEE